MSEFREPWKHETLDRGFRMGGEWRPESSGSLIRDATGEIVLSDETCDHADNWRLPEQADRVRIVAAVNFCRNLPTDTLQFYGAPLPDEKPDRTPAMEWARTIADD